jgi:hypothetical protein
VYNCIAWAAGKSHEWWWPGPDLEDEYWPPDVAREVTLAAFQAAFAGLGYLPCLSAVLEPEVEKVALFARPDGKPTHAARQLPSGRWTSKLGESEDVEHNLHDLEGAVYGRVVLVMARRRE